MTEYLIESMIDELKDLPKDERQVDIYIYLTNNITMVIYVNN